MVVLDKTGRIVIANSRYSEMMNTDQQDLKGTDFIQSQKELEEKFDLKARLETALKKNEDFTSGRIDMNTPSGEKNAALTGRILMKDRQCPYRILIQFKFTH